MSTKRQRERKQTKYIDEEKTKQDMLEYRKQVKYTAWRYMISEEKIERYKQLTKDEREAKKIRTYNKLRLAKTKEGKYKLNKRLIELFLAIKTTHSKNKIKIACYLSRLRIKYQMEARLKELERLRFDFYLPDVNLMIESDGDQHFYFPNGLHQTKEVFHKQREDDMKKNIYCFSNGINLMRISQSRINDFSDYFTSIGSRIIRNARSRLGGPIIKFIGKEYEELSYIFASIIQNYLV
jgi:very-short-patch-repair endonuclease